MTPFIAGQQHWFDLADRSITTKRGHKPNLNRAKNGIIFLGDGMGVSTITASRIFKGQKVLGMEFGEESELHMDTFPYLGTSKVRYWTKY